VDGKIILKLLKSVACKEDWILRIRIATENFCEDGNAILIVAQLVEKFPII
jgi:hypothetical protein